MGGIFMTRRVDSLDFFTMFTYLNRIYRLPNEKRIRGGQKKNNQNKDPLWLLNDVRVRDCWRPLCREQVDLVEMLIGK